MALLDHIDKKILNRIQSDFPITHSPYRAVADRLNLREADVLERVSRMREQGLIRRIGGNFVPEKLGYVSTLCAASVPQDKIQHFTGIVNQYPGVTHNYQRDNRFNIWFTFIALSRENIEINLQRIAQKTGIEKILNLPATHVFKIKAHFNL
ncbi:MAG: Lrp/AsnC family transcriptional regulator [Deltaproteobacteria bacterium]|nr:MAG: Lrp/AsnC family transcriptional regulator [Deltaproteobacteria bacterium]RLC17891.1 MAG: Lrp/AsnC family transcriptional regulator [Deltaproteobacteria bacterium]HHE75344.1 Lrp/AsnC family transcriptional regulator [Desulfobacteraceae bacterium]